MCGVFRRYLCAPRAVFGARALARARHNIVPPVSGARDAWLYADRYVLPLDGGVGCAHIGSRAGSTLGVVRA